MGAARPFPVDRLLQVQAAPVAHEEGDKKARGGALPAREAKRGAEAPAQARPKGGDGASARPRLEAAGVGEEGGRALRSRACRRIAPFGRTRGGSARYGRTRGGQAGGGSRRGAARPSPRRDLRAGLQNLAAPDQEAAGA